MCQHAFHSHIIKCFGPFKDIYTIANAFSCAHPCPSRLVITFHILTSEQALSCFAVCSNMQPENHYSITDYLMVLLLVVSIYVVPLTGSLCYSWKGDCYCVSAGMREPLILNEPSILPKEQRSQLACISQREDVPLTDCAAGRLTKTLQTQSRATCLS